MEIKNKLSRKSCLPASGGSKENVCVCLCPSAAKKMSALVCVRLFTPLNVYPVECEAYSSGAKPIYLGRLINIHEKRKP